MTIPEQITAALVAAVVTIIGSLGSWAVAWVRRKVRENEDANAAIHADTKANAGHLQELHELMNGRTAALLARNAELEHDAESAGINQELVAELKAQVAAVKVAMIEVSSHAKTALAASATRIKELVDRAAVEAERQEACKALDCPNRTEAETP